MNTCPRCTRELDDGLLYLDTHEKQARDQAKAAWKSCPRCSQVAGVHVYLPMKDFGSPVRQRRTDNNPSGLQSDCTFHRNNDNREIPRPSGARRTCGPVQSTRAPVTARAPVVRPAPRAAATPADPPPEVPLSAEQLDALVLAQVGWLKLSEEGRKVLRTHLDTERKAGNRQALLRLRLAQGPLTCDACRVSLAERYGSNHAEVVELHHLQPLSRGVQKAADAEAFALLCPTCHRVVHFRREEPLKIDEVRRMLAGPS